MQEGAKPIDSSITIIGKIYANWCGHCRTLVPEWKSMKSAIMSKPDLAKKYKFEEIESAAQERIKYINTHYLKNSESKLSLQGGYPTLFKIKDGKLSYYKGPRRANDMTNWYTNHAVKVESPVPSKFFGLFSGGKKNRTQRRFKKNRKNRKTRNKTGV